MFRLAIALWWAVMPLINVAMHKYYVSVTVIHFNTENRHLEIELHTFPDDVALALEKNYGYRIDWDKPNEQAKKFLDAYLHEHFRLKYNSKILNYKYLGFTFENDQLVLVMESNPLPQQARRLTVYNTWLTEIYRDQQNLVHLLTGKTKQSEILDREHKQTVFKLD